MPDAPGEITLREITKETLGDVLYLSVDPEQEKFVAPNAVSIAEAYFDRESAWFRGIYRGDTPVGFVMLAVDEKKPRYYLWRFMIDARYQRTGAGRRALELVFDHVRALPGATELLTSCVPGEGSPGPFYEKVGFAYTGEDDEGELVMRLPL